MTPGLKKAFFAVALVGLGLWALEKTSGEIKRAGQAPTIRASGRPVPLATPLRHPREAVSASSVCAESVPASEEGRNLADACQLIAESSDPALTEAYYCNVIGPWIAAHSHFAGKSIQELNVPSTVKLRLEAHLMAERNLSSAYQWADRLSNPQERSLALSSVLYAASLEAPESVLNFARTIDLGEQRQVVLQTIVFRWSKIDDRSAKAWLVMQP